MLKRVIVLFVIVSFFLSYYQPVYAQDFSVNELPVPGTMVGESAPFSPLALKGLIVNLQKPLEFQFIVDTGKGPQDTASIKDQGNQLVKYFLAGLTIPEGDLWVNLSPYEKNRMIPEALGQTDLGRDLLAQDYILKQLTASLIYPEKDLGKEFWSRVYAKAQQQFGTTDVPVNTFNKVWILPDQAQVFEHGAAAYVTKATLKVMLDEDYLAKQKHQQTQASSISSQIVREIVIPEITREVNTGKNFAPLRQIFQALILAKWYKETIQNSLLDAVYTNKKKIAGVNLNDPAIKEQIYSRYLQAYKKGVFNYIKEDPTPEGQTIPRKYFSGGTFLGDYAMSVDKNPADVHGSDGAMISMTVKLVAEGEAVTTNQNQKDWAMLNIQEAKEYQANVKGIMASLDHNAQVQFSTQTPPGILAQAIETNFRPEDSLFLNIQVSADRRAQKAYRDVQDIVKETLGADVPVLNMNLDETHVTLAGDDIMPGKNLTPVLNQMAEEFRRDIQGVKSFNISIVGPHVTPNGVVIMEYTTSAPEFIYLRRSAEKRILEIRPSHGLSKGGSAYVPNIIHSTIAVIRDPHINQRDLARLKERIDSYREALGPIEIKVTEITATHLRGADRRFIESRHMSLDAAMDAAKSQGADNQTLPRDIYHGQYDDSVRKAAGLTEITEDMLSVNAGLTAPRKFINQDGSLKTREERLLNNTFGINEAFFPKPSPTVSNMLMFIDRLKAEFGDKVYVLDPDSLHMTTQGLERQWDDKTLGTLKELTSHQGRDTIDINKEPVAGVLKRARGIGAKAFQIQVAGVGWDPVGGVFFEIKPYLPAGQKQDEIEQRRESWGLPSFRPPHFTAAYFAQPFNKDEVARLKEIIREYQTTVFGDMSVDELQVVAYEDYSFNSGYRTLETIHLDNERSIPTKEIAHIVSDLAKDGIFPKVNGQSLIDALNVTSPGEMVSYIKNNSILSNEEDVLELLKIKKRSSLGENLSNDDREKLMLYQVIFEAGIDHKSPMTVFSGGTGSNRLTEGLLKQGADNITLLLNAYDDGKSTGDIRRNFDVLGPSDIGKNIVVLLKSKQPALAKFLDYRFPKDADAKELRMHVAALAGDGGTGEVNQLIQGLDAETQNKLKKYFAVFLEQIRIWEQDHQKSYNFKDYGVRNILFLAAYLLHGHDYQQAINALITDFNLSGKIVLNNHEPLWLIAITEDGQLLNSEAAVVDGMLDKEISNIFLVRKLLSADEVQAFNQERNLDDKLKFIEQKYAVYPQATMESVDAVENAKAIIFAPTTFHSSLSPTLITKGIPEALKRSKGLKILVANLIRERGRQTVGEAIRDLTNYMNYGLGSQGTNALDYVVLNTHGYQTNGVSNANRLPIDIAKIRQEGVEAISINVDPKNQGKHQGDVTAQVVMTLQGIDALGYCMSQGRLIKKSEIDRGIERRAQLKSLLASPLLYRQNDDRIERLTEEILGINSLDEFAPRRKTRAVILAAGRATRLGTDIPKILFPIAGKPNLEYLMDVLATVDNEPILAIKESDVPQIQQWLRANPSYHPKLKVIPTGTGTAVALRNLEGAIQEDGAEDVLFLWGDISNISQKSLRLLLAVHEALGTSSMTIPTSWEKNPYAGLIRNEQGEIVDVFLTKEHPEQQQLFGEHDGSIFLFNVEQTMPFVHQAVQGSGYNEGKVSEVNFLKTILLMAKAGKEIYGLASMDPRETAGFNTPQEAALVAQYKQELKDGVPLKQDGIWSLISSLKGEEKTVEVTEEMRRVHKDRFERYLARHYEGIVLDVDDTLTEDGVVPEFVINKLVEIANQGRAIGFITGRTNDTLEQILLSKIRKHPKLNGASLKNFYIYPENGTYGYRLDLGVTNKFYEYKISTKDAQIASFYLRKYVLGFKDNYSITDHKIHIWPYEPFKQGEYVVKIKELFPALGLPFVVYKSNSVETTGSILITNRGTSKGSALDDFLKHTNLNADNVAKIGDLGGKGSVDFELLREEGSFTVGEFDVDSTNQVAVRLVSSELTNVARTSLLLNSLKFDSAMTALVNKMVVQRLPQGKGYENVQAVAQGNIGVVKRILDTGVLDRDPLKPWIAQAFFSERARKAVGILTIEDSKYGDAAAQLRDYFSRLVAATENLVRKGSISFDLNIRTAPATAKEGYKWGPSADRSDILGEYGYVNPDTGEVLNPEALQRLGLTRDSKVSERWFLSDDTKYPSWVSSDGLSVPLFWILHQQPVAVLGQEHYAQYNESLGEVGKILNAAEPLSWQVHLGITEGYLVVKMGQGAGLFLGINEVQSVSERQAIIVNVRQRLTGAITTPDSSIVRVPQDPGVEVSELFKTQGLQGLVNGIQDYWSMADLVKYLLIEGRNVVDVGGLGLVQFISPKPGDRLITNEGAPHALFGLNDKNRGEFIEFKATSTGPAYNRESTADQTWALADNLNGKEPRTGKVRRTPLEEALEAINNKGFWSLIKPEDYRHHGGSEQQIGSKGSYTVLHNENQYAALEYKIARAQTLRLNRFGQFSALVVRQGSVEISTVGEQVLGTYEKGAEILVPADKGDILLKNTSSSDVPMEIIDLKRPVKGVPLPQLTDGAMMSIPTTKTTSLRGIVRMTNPGRPERIKYGFLGNNPSRAPGGIDLNQINVNRIGKTINVQFDPAQLNELEQSNFKGFTPVITGFKYIQSPFPLMGINDPAKEPEVLVKA